MKMNKIIRRKESGFSMVELLITMTVFVIVIAAASSIFVPMLTQFKQQSKIAENQVEGIIGLDILRRDIEQAGFGLPWVIPDSVTYQEAVVETKTPWVDRDFNDGPPPGSGTPVRGDEQPGDSNPPGAIRSGDGYGLNNSDVLVIKATSVATNDAATKWTYVIGTSGGGNSVNVWGSPAEDLNNGDRVIVLIPMRGEDTQRILVDSGGNFSVQFSQPTFPSAYAPSTENDVFLIYGVDPDTDLRMPFNRADYYVRSLGDDMPPRCAPNTGILFRATVNQADGLFTETRLLECVADMQVLYGWDVDEDGDFEPWAGGSTDTYIEDINPYPASDIREYLKEVRVYILAQEGQKDTGYNFSGFTGACATCVRVGQWNWGSDFDLLAIIGNDYRYYRWKVYTIVVKPANLKES